MLWARRAADAGDAVGEFNVGVLFDNGLGVPQDKSAAALWFARAAEHGDDSGEASLRELASEGVAEATAAVVRMTKGAAAASAMASRPAAAAGVNTPGVR